MKSKRKKYEFERKGEERVRDSFLDITSGWLALEVIDGQCEIVTTIKKEGRITGRGERERGRGGGEGGK